VPVFYDPLVAKLSAWAEDRPMAITRMRRPLGEYRLSGIKTTLPLFACLLERPARRAPSPRGRRTTSGPCSGSGP
jgi:acetyl/propionyl-CoA carboxylase alpha subunit